MLETLTAGWYVLCYHDVRWSEPRHLHGLSICHPPDVFAEHVRLCRALGDVVSFEEGRRRTLEKPLNRPQFTFTFDDGYRGVIDHAAPALDALGTSGVAAINPPFITGESTFWRAQMCWIREAGGLDDLRSALHSIGYSTGSMRDHTMDHFTEPTLDVIEATYTALGGPERDVDRDELHLDEADILSLRDRGWLIANHSARHLPLLEATAEHAINAEFAPAEEWLEQLLGDRTRLWVAPFDRPLQRVPSAVTSLRREAAPRMVALVDDRPTTADNIREDVAYRVFAPMAGPAALLTRLRRAARRGRSEAPHRTRE